MAKSQATSGFGTSLKRGDAARKTATLLNVTANDVLTVNGLAFTAHATVTTAANREFAINGGTDTLDATELLTCLNDTTYGLPSLGDNITATQNGAVITIHAPPDVTMTVTDTGTTITVADATETFTAVAEITNISLSGFSTEMIDVTHMESPSMYREKRPTFLDAGQVTCEMNYVPAGAQQSPSTGFLADFEDRAERNYKIVFPDQSSTTVLFAAYVSNFSINAPMDDKCSATLTLDIDGAVTWS